MTSSYEASNPETDEAVKDLIARLNADIEFLSAEIWVDASLKPTLKNLREAVELLSRPSAQGREKTLEDALRRLIRKYTVCASAHGNGEYVISDSIAFAYRALSSPDTTAG